MMYKNKFLNTKKKKKTKHIPQITNSSTVTLNSKHLNNIKLYEYIYSGTRRLYKSFWFRVDQCPWPMIFRLRSPINHKITVYFTVWPMVFRLRPPNNHTITMYFIEWPVIFNLRPTKKITKITVYFSEWPVIFKVRLPNNDKITVYFTEWPVVFSHQIITKLQCIL